jgi:hypothetical protein
MDRILPGMRSDAARLFFYLVWFLSVFIPLITVTPFLIALESVGISGG